MSLVTAVEACTIACPIHLGKRVAIDKRAVCDVEHIDST